MQHSKTIDADRNTAIQWFKASGNMLGNFYHASIIELHDPEQALMRTNDKFQKRLNGIEDELSKTGRSIYDVDSDDLELLWLKQKDSAST